MKAVALALLVVAAAAYAVPAKPFAVDWPAVQAKVDECYDVIEVALYAIIAEGHKGDATLGAEIERILVGYIPAAQDIFKAATAEIEAQTLTVAGAEAYFAQLDALLKQAEAEVTPYVLQLPPVNAAEIKRLLDTAYAKVEELAKDIYALLAQ